MIYSILSQIYLNSVWVYNLNYIDMIAIFLISILDVTWFNRIDRVRFKNYH